MWEEGKGTGAKELLEREAPSKWEAQPGEFSRRGRKGFLKAEEEEREVK